MGGFRSSRNRKLFLIVLGLVTGAAAGANRVAMWSVVEDEGAGVLQVVLAAGGMAGLFLLAIALLQWVTGRVLAGLDQAVRERFARRDALAYLPALATLGGVWGQKPLPVVALLVIVLAIKALMLIAVLTAEQRKKVFVSQGYLAFLFLVSGFAALIYQIVWQRTLFAAYGVNIESITIIVSLFMFGLGLGSLAGGALVKRYPRRALGLFLLCQCGVGLFGIVSIPVIHRVAAATLHASLPVVSCVIFALLAIPTFLMGATLPILVGHVYRYYRNVGKSVGVLYSINTLGSAMACYLTADVLFVLTGQQSSVLIAAACNGAVGVLVWRYGKRLAAQEGRTSPGPAQPPEPAPSAAAAPADLAAPRSRAAVRIFVVFFAAATGYISLTQEILWMRVVSYMTGGAPTVFARVLGSFLIGVALGALYGKRLCERGFPGGSAPRAVARLLLISGVFYFVSIAGTSVLLALSPAAALITTHVVLGVVSFLLGGIFTILCHHAARAGGNVGSTVGKLYLANIIGCTLGPLLTGFVLMDHFTTSQIVLGVSLATLALGALAYLFASGAPRLLGPVAAVAAGALLLVGFKPMYADLFLRLHGRGGVPLKYLVQNRSGVIVVTPSEMGDVIFGGGLYDGRFTIDPVVNANGIRRCYMMAALHPNPKRALEVGLSSGSWARVMAYYQPLAELVIVEINPGYNQLIEKYQPHKTLLTDPKVKIHIDDGRRWLNRNPDEKFDFILQNTTYHWRSHITNLLSEEYLRLCKRHLNPGGVFYYNTTSSPDIPYTAANVFKHVVRYSNFVAASDSPFQLTEAQIRANLMKFITPEGPILAAPECGEALDEMATSRLEDVAESLRRRDHLNHITDDNMATEYKRFPLFDRNRSWWALVARSTDTR